MPVIKKFPIVISDEITNSKFYKIPLNELKQVVKQHFYELEIVKKLNLKWNDFLKERLLHDYVYFCIMIETELHLKLFSTPN